MQQIMMELQDGDVPRADGALMCAKIEQNHQQ